MQTCNGVPQLFSSHSGGGMPLPTSLPFLASRVVPQLAPLGWRSFQALAEEQAAQVQSPRFTAVAPDLPFAPSYSENAGFTGDASSHCSSQPRGLRHTAFSARKPSSGASTSECCTSRGQLWQCSCVIHPGAKLSRTKTDALGRCVATAWYLLPVSHHDAAL